jgi:hypothetical protein
MKIKGRKIGLIGEWLRAIDNIRGEKSFKVGVNSRRGIQEILFR